MSAHSDVAGGNTPTYVEVLDRGHRTKILSSKLRGYVTNTVVRQAIDLTPSTTTAPVSQSHSSGKQFDIACYVDYNNFSMRHKCFLNISFEG